MSTAVLHADALERMLRVLPASLALSGLALLFFVDPLVVLAGFVVLLLVAGSLHLRTSLLLLVVLLPTNRVGVGLPGLKGVGVFDFYSAWFALLFLWRVVVMETLEMERNKVLLLGGVMFLSFLPSLINASAIYWAGRAFLQLLIGLFIMAGVYDGLRRVSDRSYVHLLLTGLWILTTVMAVTSLYLTFNVRSLVALVGGRTTNPLFSDPNYYATFLIMMLCIGIALAATARNRIRRLAHLAVIGLVIVSIILGMSRSGYLVTLLVLLGYGAYFYRYYNVRRAIGVVALAALAVGIFIIAATNLGSRVVDLISISNRLETATTGKDVSVNQRRNILVVGWRAAQHTPLFGVGFGNFEVVFDRFREGELSTGNARAAHNTFLKILVECGIVGAIGAIAFFGALFWTVFGAVFREHRPRERMIMFSLAMALAAFCGMSMTLDQIYEAHFWLLAGLSLAYARSLRNRPADALPVRNGTTAG